MAISVPSDGEDMVISMSSGEDTDFSMPSNEVMVITKMPPDGEFVVLTRVVAYAVLRFWREPILALQGSTNSRGNSPMSIMHRSGSPASKRLLKTLVLENKTFLDVTKSAPTLLRKYSLYSSTPRPHGYTWKGIGEAKCSYIQLKGRVEVEEEKKLCIIGDHQCRLSSTRGAYRGGAP